jgi:hypothetical protein
MDRHLRLAVAFVAICVLAQCSPAEACGGGGPSPLSAHVNAAAAVFVGVVEGVSGEHPVVFGSFLVTKVYRGRLERRAVVTGYCGIAFKKGESYLVYAEAYAGRLMTTSLNRTRPLAAAAEDVKYLDNLASGRPQAIVYGEMFQAVTARDGTRVKRALFETLKVVAVSARGRHSVDTDRWGPYQIVLAPGSYELWGERRGRRVTRPMRLRVRAGEERRLSFTAEYR